MTSMEELHALESIASAIRGDSEDDEGICRIEGSRISNKFMQPKSFLLVKEEVVDTGDNNIDRMIVPADKVTKEQFNSWKREDKHTVEEISGERLAELIDEEVTEE